MRSPDLPVPKSPAALWGWAILFGGLVPILFLFFCHRPSTPSPKETASGSTFDRTDPLATASFPTVAPESPPRLRPILQPGELTLALPPCPAAPTPSLDQDAMDSLHNMAIAPDDLENGWHWAREVLRNLPTQQQPAFLDQLASLTPARYWDRLDPVLYNPAWGQEILQTLFRRLLTLPLSDQLPRLVRIAENGTHPCRIEAESLLRAYFPQVQPGQFGEYRQCLRMMPGS